eukprot:TRINITY_DN339657_c0_g1_i1.p1 TRINITY_DN339657_c0_g1~~TRINITY_DN339657_c0_g1_i1.p1  ORF type:complete len:160 (-),score=31.32 TRINITY_DN339657_c0_g1_i1:23-457(-)
MIMKDAYDYQAKYTELITILLASDDGVVSYEIERTPRHVNASFGMMIRQLLLTDRLTFSETCEDPVQLADCFRATYVRDGSYTTMFTDLLLSDMGRFLFCATSDYIDHESSLYAVEEVIQDCSLWMGVPAEVPREIADEWIKRY